ncbi:hypothetical protein [Secundilactobacillus muriivasis]|jgi:hypothetical protein
MATQRTQIDANQFAYTALNTIHFRDCDNYERQLKERLTVFLMAKYLIDDFNNLENRAFDGLNNNDVALSKLGFDELLKKIEALNQY